MLRLQAEENGRRLSELASREETIEIESARVDKARAELDARKLEQMALGQELDAKALRLRDEEARRAAELRTWQQTLESQQALLKGQQETFEKEMSDVRSSWADRVMRVDEREASLAEKEEKVRSDIEWVARTDEDLKRRETSAAEAVRQASDLKAESERVLRDVEQRTLELDSRERAMREEAARHAVDLAKQTEALKLQQDEIAAKRNELDADRASRTQQFQAKETELHGEAQSLETKARELAERETRIASTEEALRQADQRTQRERMDVQALNQQVDARQLELNHLKERYEAEAARVRSEADATRQ